MNKIKNIWIELKRYEKIAFVIGEICAVLVILFAGFQLLGIWDIAINVCEVLLGVLMITQTILQWKKNRTIAIFSLCVATFIFIVAFIIFFLR